jgi:DNA-binding NtrC family response regulator
VRVAILDSSNDDMAMLKIILEEEGLQTCAANLHDLVLGKQGLKEFLERCDPRVVIYDIPYPYAAHCKYLDRVLEQGLFRGREVILTTTNPQVVRELEGCREVNLLVGKPFELNQFLTVVHASAARAASREPGAPPEAP